MPDSIIKTERHGLWAAAAFVLALLAVVIGLVAGKVMSLAGYGSVKPADPRAPHGVA